MNLKINEKDKNNGNEDNSLESAEDSETDKCEKTLVIIKPGGIQRKVVGEIISRFEKAGLEIEKIRMLHIDTSIAHMHYSEHSGKHYFNNLVEYMTSGPSLIMVLKGPDAIIKARDIMGPTDPSVAPKGTIRGDFGNSISFNAIHGSDCEQSAEREINIFFGSYL